MHRVWPNSGLPGQLAQDLRTVAHMEQAVTLVEPQQLARSLPTGPDPGPILGSIEQALDSGIDHIYLHQIGDPWTGSSSSGATRSVLSWCEDTDMAAAPLVESPKELAAVPPTAMTESGDAARMFDASDTLDDLARIAESCTACELHADATHVVFGEGEPKASIMILGEQPGDEEDKQGKPFVGPAGSLLDSALEEAGVPRDHVYITNIVKHFRFEERGKKRLHKSPTRTNYRFHPSRRVVNWGRRPGGGEGKERCATGCSRYQRTSDWAAPLSD